MTIRVPTSNTFRNVSNLYDTSKSLRQHTIDKDVQGRPYHDAPIIRLLMSEDSSVS